MYEHKSEPLLNRKGFVKRLLNHGGLALLVTLGGLTVGTIGYHATEKNLSWLDAALNAAMILTGMGQVSVLKTDCGKIFAICYSLLSGFLFLAIAGILLSPVIHRILHHFHLDKDSNGSAIT